MTIGAWLWLVVLIPATAGVVMLIGGQRANASAGPATIAVAAAVVVLAVFAWIARPMASFSWLPIAGDSLNLHLSAAAEGAPLAVFVAVVSLLILIYSEAYLERDEARARFFGFMALFLAGMELLVLADDLLSLLLAWELVGLCSYLLISFWYTEPERVQAANRAFLTTRTADLGLYLACMAAFAGAGGFGLTALSQMDTPWRGIVAAGLVLAAAGKSAQLPFSGWLSGAMLGPSPVSALLHSATMVAAGAVLLLKTLPLLETVTWALPLVLWLGVATTLTAALIALYQDDLKQMLAASTASQYGYIFAALGAAGPAAAAGHLYNHAAYKATLFLVAGVLLHEGLKRFETMGGLARRMLVSASAFGVSALALAALPPLGGYFSKEAVLVVVKEASATASVLLLLGSFLTAAYAARAWFRAFAGQPRSAEALRARDAGKVINVPMLVLAALALALGLWLLPPLKSWWAATLAVEPLHAFSLSEALWSLALAAAGVLWIGTRHWRFGEASFGFDAGLGRAADRWFGLIDMLDGIARGVLALARALAAFDIRAVAAATIEGVRRVTLGFAAGFRQSDRQVFDRIIGWLTHGSEGLAGWLWKSDKSGIDRAIGWLTSGLDGLAGRLSQRQSGLLHHYYALATVGMLGLLIYALLTLGV